MRLIHTTTFEIHEFPGDSDKDYAILSHTWSDEECSFQDMSKPECYKARRGFEKIKFCCDQAALDGLEWAWADTCCINKDSTAELSEAINSMFRWYRKAAVCYVYLSDVTNQTDLASSRWFTRGWTLQELIAPSNVQFYSSNWKLLGSKDTLQDTIQCITEIDKVVLSSGTFGQVCIARRMAWAAKRTTTRTEDQAYSLMGIFDVNMPLIYGEGKKAFLRLQQEILRVSDDQSLFAWGAPRVFRDMHMLAMSGSDRLQTRTLLADSPADFLTSHEILQVRNKEDTPPPVIYGNGVRVQYPVCAKMQYHFIMIACTIRGRNTAHLAIPMRRCDGSFYVRCGSLVLVFADDWPKFQVTALVVKEPTVNTLTWPTGFRILRVPNHLPSKRKDCFNLVEVYCAPHATYCPTTRSVTLLDEYRYQDRIHAALFFKANSLLSARKCISGVFPFHYFAIVLGGRDPPRITFVPILREDHADADFHELFRANPQLIKNCMLRSQLVATVLMDDESKLATRTPSLKMVLGAWTEHLLTAGYCKLTRKTIENWQLQIQVTFRIAPANLVEDGIFVFIDLHEVNLGSRASVPCFQDISYVADAEYSNNKWSEPSWFEVDRLEWFMEKSM
ncbi:hypothetical protein HD806DRAFT_509468 [Xylariaceae sp. AK1471]|nr:hypothetical protein HD806DRAFT_509468 [Xylariaceae sp. AK1471]